MTTIIILPLWRRKIETVRRDLLAALPPLRLFDMAHIARIEADPNPGGRMLRLALAAEIRDRMRAPCAPEVLHLRKETPCP